MKTNQIIPSFLVLLLIFSSCKTEPKTELKTESKSEAKKGRDMFGIGIPRGLTKTTEGLAGGYIMFPVPNSPFVYLINRNGEVVHQWKGNYSVLGAYLMDDGSLFQGAEDPDYPVFGFGGPYGRIQKINWDSKMLWDFEYANEDHIVHHDFTVMPNGHILAISYEGKSYEEAISRGRKSEMTPKDGPWLEKIIEIEPQGKMGGNIVWEWHVWDHLIQDKDTKKPNYGNPADHPELLDFNMGNPLPPTITQDSMDILHAQGKAERNATVGNLGADIFHFNAIKYNPTLDQIVISSPQLNEIFILDHSTKTQEAASHKGGKSGKGGDFLYRWGNAKNYKRGDSTAQQLFGQHDVRWVEEGKPGAGHLTIYNNHPPRNIDWELQGGDSLNYSAVYELALPLDEKGNYIISKNKPFGPEKPIWSYMAPDKVSFYSSFISGAHRMKNGNTFINEGAKGRFFEVTPDGKIVWEYLNPYRGEIRKPNGDPNQLMPMVFSEFRSTFISADHPGLAGRKLEPFSPQPKAFVLPPPTPAIDKK